jgi:hypothetical protein
MSVHRRDTGASVAATSGRPKTYGGPQVRNAVRDAARVLDAQRQQRVERVMQVARQRRFREGS